MELFDKNEDLRFSDYVRRYNSPSTPKEEKAKMEGFIEERTKRLLYLIPKRNLLLGDEDLAAFYLELQKDMRRYIESFTIEGTSYNGYLAKICRYRVMRFRRDKNSKKFTEMAMTRSSQAETIEAWRGGTLKEAALSYQPSWYPEGDDLKDLPFDEVLEILMETERGFSWTNNKERLLGESLMKSYNRSCFLIYLLSMPVYSEPGSVNIAGILGSPVQAVERFFEIKHQTLEAQKKRSDRLSKSLSLIDSYWVLVQENSLAMDMEFDEEKKRQHMAKYEKYLQRMRKKQAEVLKLKRGLTQQQIADLFHCSRAKISGCIEKGRNLIAKANEE